jgi:sulfite reductase (NADPH) hemoprotein beta-component
MSVVTTSDSLLFAIPHLYKLASYPVIIHVLLSQNPCPDYSTITALRQTGFAILQSGSLQEAQDISLTSHSLALFSGNGVMHFTEASQNDVPIPEENPDFLKLLLTCRTSPGRDLDEPRLPSLYRRDLEDRDSSMQTLDETLSSQVTSQNTASELAAQNNENSVNGNSVHGSNGNGQPELPGLSASKTVDETGEGDANESRAKMVTKIFDQIANVTGRHYSCFEYSGPASAHSVIIVFGSMSNSLKLALAQAQASDSYSGMGIIIVRLYRPWFGSALWDSIPPGLKKIAVVEQLRHRTTKWGAVFMDVLTSSRARAAPPPTIVSYQLGRLSEESLSETLAHIATNLQMVNPQHNVRIGLPFGPQAEDKLGPPHLENAYIKVLRQLFGDNLNILNTTASSTSGVATEISSSPEYLLGAYITRTEKRKELVSDVSAAARAGKISQNELTELLSRWVSERAQGSALDETTINELLGLLRQQDSSLTDKLLSDPWLFRNEVPWIIGSESWAFDLGSSGVHHLLASGKNVNMLIIDSHVSSQPREGSLEHRKKDIGLYAMNFGNAYVASVAIYSSYTHVMHAMVEAQQFNGPSIVLAYLPYSSELDSPLQLLQETKVAVDSGSWPLYRWTPASTANGEPVFELDSERVKKELKDFIDRENHFTHLVRGEVALSARVSHSHGSELRRLKKIKAKEAMDKLMDGLSGPPVSILFASDGGNAESLAKRIARRGKARGLKPKLLAMDDFPVEELPNEENIVFCTSTAGQGEFPQNGREMWDALKNSTDLDLSRVKYTVFALGDSHYWPRKEDKIYYNKPGKDLDARLEALGGSRLVPIGLGDDQDPDSFETGYGVWEPSLWKALGADQVDVDFEEPKPLTNEDIKIASNFLRGTIADGLADPSTGAISETDAQLTKFHGTYMQDDRDLRDERKTQGLEPAYSFMVRVRMSGGVCQPEQWIAMDHISSKWGNETFKLVSNLGVSH